MSESRVSVRVSLARQELLLMGAGRVLRRYRVSTAAAGADERNGSLGTPRGRHVVRARIGDGAPVGTVFRGRRPTGEIYDETLGRRYPGRDWILTRILWLSGCEQGFNRLGDVDTMRRYIYVHGTPDSTRLGVAGSHGCIRMNNADIAELFDRVPAGTRVDIRED
ncbi:MAG TPA: L,D-transpeptidase [Gammaproteobacteria bacterium]|nr:L,D-transpeptidase [Gammaproteobacteria bacterium]